MKKPLVLLMVALLLAAIFVGCGKEPEPETAITILRKHIAEKGTETDLGIELTKSGGGHKISILATELDADDGPVLGVSFVSYLSDSGFSYTYMIQVYENRDMSSWACIINGDSISATGEMLPGTYPYDSAYSIDFVEPESSRERVMAILPGATEILLTIVNSILEDNDIPLDASDFGFDLSIPVPTPEPSNWEIAHYVDDFGDPTADRYLRGSFSGRFSNTATSGSNLDVIVFYGSSISFRLFEYGRLKATFSSRDDLILKIKVDEKVDEYRLSGTTPNGDLYLFGDGFTQIGAYLKDGKEISCIITIGSSRYSFSIDGIGFAREYDKWKSS
ncbi:MAG: hypothetical protein FWE69_02800 [Clostridiales bacterium]|nr:hypothetical protein [Clostridiales bacterium]